ncbi:MAG: alanine racemase [Verrucomicrobiota bacterium]
MNRSWCEIDLNAIRHNLTFVRKQVGPSVGVMPMVKADAYGHGIEKIAPLFQKERCDFIGCAQAMEGIRLRRLGVKLPILLLSGFLEEELEEIASKRLSITVSSLNEAKKAQSWGKRTGFPISVHVKVDTGMGRLGCSTNEASSLLSFVEKASHLNLEGFYSHYACADDSVRFTRTQWKRFSQIKSPPGVIRHICNAAGMLSLPESHADLVRPGIVLFGSSPVPKFQPKLKPALSWYSRVVAIRSVPKGTTLSYGATYTTPRRMTIATLSVGYGDGFFRRISNRGYVLIQGKRCKILGRVTMDQLVVDTSQCPKVRKGEKAVLLGKSKKEAITAGLMAQWAETIPYEIWCHITERVVKEYV